jgi:signal transduction histidine kinase
MSSGGPSSERALILAPAGRDAAIATSILNEAGIASRPCKDLDDLCNQLEVGAAVALVVEEALHNSDLTRLSRWIEAQPAWSDFPFVLLAQRGGGLERNPMAGRLVSTLGNVSFLERPFHPTTLVSAARTALRGRLRQYEARARIDEIRRGEARLEARVIERTGELEAANRQLAGQIGERERIERALRQSQRLEAIGQLTSGISHDFNNLLMVVLGTVRMMRTHTSDPNLHRRLDMIAEAAQRGAKLTAQMLAFSRRQKLEPRAVNLNDTVVGMRDMLQTTMGGSIRIETALGDELWPAMIDPTQIELALLNLAINARDAMEVGGLLAIETANASLKERARPEEPPAGDYVMVSVRDTGSGMSEAVLAKAFEPFFTTKEVGKGSGLGLSQVYGLAKQSGGGVRIETTVGKGTCVKIFLPRAADRATVAVAASSHEAATRLHGRTVLLVDDDGPVRQVTAGMLEELGCRVVESGSGGRALEEIDHNPAIQLVLLDFAMPGMNGAEVAREIKARRPGLPIVFATGYVDAALAVGVEPGDILQKPFDPGELATKLTQAL